MLDLSRLRSGKTCRKLSSELRRTAAPAPGMCFMEVCGTHTHSFFRHGLNSMLPENVRLISGPGCPVCVTPAGYIDKAVYYSRRDDVIIATFGDMFRVPGSTSSLEKEKAAGADIRIVYSPLESLDFAEQNKGKKVIFLAIGFETTIPAVTATLLEADRKRNVSNWFVLSGHKVIPPAMKALVSTGDLKIDGFMCPGHVSAIIGSRPYEFIARDFGIPCVITGFEPADMLQGILMLVRQKVRGGARVSIQYSRTVREEGNPRAISMMEDVYETCTSEWRGVGAIPGSGLKLREKYGRYDIENVLEITGIEPEKEAKGCICGEVLKGIRIPPDCRLFGRSCTPETPVGACMVSSEGTCSAYYKYRQ